jgi:sarcosine oxidase subunit delta
MLLITCPHCGPRSESEFRHAGEAHLVRPADPSTLDDQAWGEFLYHRRNPKGLHKERWRHIHGCARFFNMVRDTTTDRILVTYPSGAPTPPLPGESA